MKTGWHVTRVIYQSDQLFKTMADARAWWKKNPPSCSGKQVAMGGIHLLEGEGYYIDVEFKCKPKDHTKLKIKRLIRSLSER